MGCFWRHLVVTLCTAGSLSLLDDVTESKMAPRCPSHATIPHVYCRFLTALQLNYV